MARYALVIGITVNDASLGTLRHSSADAGAIAAVLREHGEFRVEVLTSPEQTTYKAIAAKLKEFFETRALRHEVLVYYTGHGFGVVDDFGEVEGFLAASDCVVEWDTNGKAIAQRNGVSLSAISKLAARSELSNLVMLLDCCHSGFLLEESLLKQTFAAFIQKDYWLLTACRSFESAYAKTSDTYSLFTGAVLGGLGRERSDERGVITAGELFAWVTKALREEPQEVMQLAIGRPIELVRYQREIVVETVELRKYPEKLNADDSLAKILQSLRKELFMAKKLRDLIILEMTVNSNTDKVKLCDNQQIITEFYSITHDIQTSIKQETIQRKSPPLATPSIPRRIPKVFPKVFKFHLSRTLLVIVISIGLKTVIENRLPTPKYSLDSSDKSIKIVAERLFKEGNIYGDEHNFSSAMESYSEAIKLDQNEPKYYFSRGNVFNDIKKYDSAIEDYTKAIFLKPDDFRFYRARGNTYSDKREYSNAIQDYTSAIRVNSSDADLYERRGNTYNDINNYNRAIEDYQKVVELSKSEVVRRRMESKIASMKLGKS